MNRLQSALFFFFPIWVLVAIAGCDIPKSLEEGKSMSAARGACSHWFQENTSPSPQANAVWGLKLEKAYGFDCPNINFLGFSQVPVERVGEDPPVYKCIAKCWLEGLTDAGNRIKIERDLHLELKCDSFVNGCVVIPHFHFDSKLTFWSQIGNWLLWVYAGPIIILLFGFVMFGDHRAASLTASVLTLPWIGYISYLGFGDTLSIIFGIVVFFLLQIPIMIVMAANRG